MTTFVTFTEKGITAVTTKANYQRLLDIADLTRIGMDVMTAEKAVVKHPQVIPVATFTLLEHSVALAAGHITGTYQLMEKLLARHEVKPVSSPLRIPHATGRFEQAFKLTLEEVARLFKVSVDDVITKTGVSAEYSNYPVSPRSLVQGALARLQELTGRAPRRCYFMQIRRWGRNDWLTVPYQEVCTGTLEEAISYSEHAYRDAPNLAELRILFYDLRHNQFGHQVGG